MKSKYFSRVMAVVLTVAVLVCAVPSTVLATIPDWSQNNVVYDGATFGTDGYYNVISKKDYTLVPGAATETEMVLNNAAGNRRQVLHIIEVDPSNPDVSILPGYYGIDKFAEDPADVANQNSAGVTALANYYDTTLGYKVVGAMNTGLNYGSNAPYSYLVYNGQVLVDRNNNINNFHPAAQGYCKSILCVYKDEITGECSCELRTYSQGLRGDEWQAIGANFAMTVNNGQLVTKTVSRSTGAARSMVGVKEDGTLVLVMNDGRGSNNSVGFGDGYELGEAMLSLGCKWAFNCDGGGSSSFVTRRAGEDDLVCRCVPCDGAERPTLNSVVVVSNVAPTGVLNNIDITSDYDYFAPGTTYTFGANAIDTHGYAMDMPNDVSWALSDDTFGTIDNGTFASNGKLGTVKVQAISGGDVVGEKQITIANPTTLSFPQASTVLPYGKSTTLSFTSLIGEAKVYLDESSFNFAMSNPSAGVLDGWKFTATTDETIASTVITATYLPTNTDISYTVNFGKGSEVIWDFEDGDLHGFMSQEDAEVWQQENGNNAFAALYSGGNISTSISETAFLSTKENGGQVHGGNNAFGLTIDMTQVGFNTWTYANIYNVEGVKVLRDTANGKNATTFGMWVYIPYGFRTEENKGSMAIRFDFMAGADAEHLVRTNFNGAYNGKNVNSLTEADIPENRWIYVTTSLTSYNYVRTEDPTNGNEGYSPDLARMYVKPSVAQTLTYYFDDFTLDYSSAVDDRVPPVISNPQYAPADENIAFADNVAITAPSAGFTAYVSDANSGIDASTAQIYVDGNKVTTKVTGNMMFCDAVSLGCGTHKVKFEIADNLGNYTTLTRTLISNTTDSTMSKRIKIELAGHNDSGETPMPGSVYYIDVNKSAGSAITTAQFTIDLNTANTWNLEQITVARGYSVTYTVDPIYPNKVTFTCTSTNYSDAQETIMTVPVNVYNPLLTNGSSDGGSVTVSGVSFEAPLYAEITSCLVDNTYGNYDRFEVSALNANHEIIRHEHTATPVEDLAPTCVDTGYTGRTYCEVCQSIVDFGTTVAAVGHTYELIDDTFVCSVCDDVYDAGTGLFEMNGKYYYAIGGNLIKGWQDIDGVYHLFNEDYSAVTGRQKIGGIHYQFAEDGMLLHDVFVTTENGIKCYYGPSNYIRGWQTIEGEKYYFDEQGYALTGYGVIRVNRNDPNSDTLAYLFDEDGKYIEDVTGSGLITTGKGDVYYIEDGKTVHAGLIKVDGYYYYISGTGKAVTGINTISQWWTNDLLPAGTYEFDTDGKMLNAPAELEENFTGISDGIYYENGEKTHKGLVYIDGYYYYINGSCQAVTGEYTVSQWWTNDLLPAGVYTFDADGRMIDPPATIADDFTGIHDGIYYENGEKTHKGLVYVDGYYYYINGSCQAVTGEYNVTQWWTNDLLPAGVYTFDADGRMIDPPAPIADDFTGIHDGIYYENGEKTHKGLVYIDGYFYYINGSCQAVTGEYNVTQWWTNDLLPAGTYTFDTDGKMIDPPTPAAEDFTGIKDGIYYVNGEKTHAGLIYLDGYYYYINGSCKAVTGEYSVSQWWTNGLLPAGVYTFDDEGKMIF